jgi:hypothetical protein
LRDLLQLLLDLLNLHLRGSDGDLETETTSNEPAAPGSQVNLDVDLADVHVVLHGDSSLDSLLDCWNKSLLGECGGGDALERNGSGRS